MEKPKTKRTRSTTAKRAKSPRAKKNAATHGTDLLNQLITLTGIPGRNIKRELEDILEKKNIDIHTLTMDQLRGVVATYLRQIMGGIMDRYHGRRPELPH